MRTFYIISETEMKEVGMKPPELEDFKSTPEAGGGYRVTNWPDYEMACVVFNKHLAAAPVFQHRLNKKGLVSEEDFVFMCGALYDAKPCYCKTKEICERLVAIPNVSPNT